jgi:RHS repeat-associated protein
MFTGRRFDIETGLYYYRARYYNPHIGRFMQTDPVGYGDGMNMYTYCGNNSLNLADPTGTHSYSFSWAEKGFDLKFFDDDGEQIGDTYHGESVFDFTHVMGQWQAQGHFDNEWMEDQDEGGLWENSAKDSILFWDLRILKHMGVFSGEEYRQLGNAGVKIKRNVKDPKTGRRNCYDIDTTTVYWGGMVDLGFSSSYDKAPEHAILAHELDHAYYELFLRGTPDIVRWEIHAVRRENKARYAYFEHSLKVGFGVYPRVSYLGTTSHDMVLPSEWTNPNADVIGSKRYWAQREPVIYD